MSRGSLAVVLLGATGRLGTPLARQLGDLGAAVFAVIRHQRPDMPDVLRLVETDVASAADRTQAGAAIAALLVGYPRVVVIDSLLDRSSATAMRRSIEGSTTLALELARGLRTSGSNCQVIVASTTAVLAPVLLQTPYGLAKARQLRRYASEAVEVSAFLLPSLSDGRSSNGEQHGLWTYENTAQSIVDHLTDEPDIAARTRHLFAPSQPPYDVHRPEPSRAVDRMTRALRTHYRLFRSGKDSPQAHRASSHARLDLLPRAARLRLDHHLVPVGRLNVLSTRLNLPLSFLN